MAKKHVKRCPASLVIMKMQIRTTMRYQLTRKRMATLKKEKKSTGEKSQHCVYQTPQYSTGYYQWKYEMCSHCGETV